MSLRLAHLSDAHIGPLPRPQGRELVGKRFTGYLNWTRSRAYIHDMGMLGRLVEDLEAHRPDHIAMTGDILNIGLRAEFPLARRWLETLGPPRDVSFVPGNHDAYAKGTMPDLVATFAPWTRGDAETKPPYPYLRVRKQVALIGLASGIPTPPIIATGRLGRAQCAALANMLEECAAAGLLRVIMIHHPPHRGGATIGRGLSDAAEFENIIAAYGAELILHGHNHKASVAQIAGPKRPVPIVGVASASAIRGTLTHRAGYHLFEIEGTPNDYRIQGRARGIMPGTSDIGDLGKIDL
ncbi:MAG: metallophosphoesterase family protein [Beijerinckiaceae bacterium]